jgi:hypothetical protein
MRTIKIFVEGLADQQFLFHYISHISSKTVKRLERNKYRTEDGSIEILATGGWTQLASNALIQAQMKENLLNKGMNLVIFDADKDVAARRQEIESIRSKSGIHFELFLFPNNRDAGALEDLLEQVIAEKNRPIFDCWQNYEKCIGGQLIDGKRLTVPAKKSKIYAYLEALLGETREQKEHIKDPKRDYSNANHWDLDSAYLNGLKEWLGQFLEDV